MGRGISAVHEVRNSAEEPELFWLGPNAAKLNLAKRLTKRRVLKLVGQTTSFPTAVPRSREPRRPLQSIRAVGFAQIPVVRRPSAGPVATPAGMSATADSILKDFLSFNDDIRRPIDGYLLAFDRDVTILLHGDRRRAGLQHDLVARRNRDLLAYHQRLVITHAGRAILADRRRLVIPNIDRLVVAHADRPRGANRNRARCTDGVSAWWIDGVASLAIVWLLFKEGREAWAGRDCC